MSSIFGPNFDVEERSDGIAVVRVWRRPDLTREEGARCAELIVGHMRRLAKRVAGCIFDLTRATTTWGPATHHAIGQMLAAWESSAKPIFIIHPNEAITRILLRELQLAKAPQFGKLVATYEEAFALLGSAAGAKTSATMPPTGKRKSDPGADKV